MISLRFILSTPFISSVDPPSPGWARRGTNTFSYAPTLFVGLPLSQSCVYHPPQQDLFLPLSLSPFPSTLDSISFTFRTLAGCDSGVEGTIRRQKGSVPCHAHARAAPTSSSLHSWELPLKRPRLRPYQQIAVVLDLSILYLYTERFHVVYLLKRQTAIYIFPVDSSLLSGKCL